MDLDALIVRVERGLMRRLPAALVVPANALLHRWKGERELAELRRLVAPGTVAVDVGAHFGTYSYALAKLVGSTGKVLAVEPIVEDATMLRRAAARLRLPLKVHQLALSSTTGMAELRVPTRHGKHKTALSSLEAHDETGEVRSVAVSTLDDLLAGETGAVSFVKIDVEGHEAAVLAGAQATIERHHPAFLIEIEGRFEGKQVADIVGLLTDRGYRCEFLDANGQRQPFTAFNPARHQDPALDPLDPRYIANFIFIWDGPGEASRRSR